MQPNHLISRCALAAIALSVACHAPAGAPLDAGSGPGTWREMVPLPQERFEAYAIGARGHVYYLGGITDLCPDLSAACVSDHVDVLDPTTQVWTPGPPLPAAAPRHHLAVAAVGDTIYVLGGFTGILGGTQVFQPIATTWAFDGVTWTERAPQPLARGSATAQTINGQIFVAGGGIAEPDARNDLYVYDPQADRWSLRTPMPTPREHVASCVLGNRMLVLGGWRSDRSVVGTVEVYDPATDRWTALPDLLTPRGGLAANVVGDVCYAVGGEQWVGPLPGTFDANEGFAVSSTAWQPFAPLPHRRHGLGLAQLGGSLYSVGGGPSRGNSYTNLVEVFTP